MSGIIIAFTGALMIMFVWTPLGFFTWFGMPGNVISFNEGYRLQAALLLIVYYGANLLLLFRLVRSKKRWMYGITICMIWVVGFGGFVRYFQSFAQ